MRSVVCAVVFALLAASAGKADTIPSAAPTAASPPEAPAPRHYRFARIEMEAAAYSEQFKNLFDTQPSFDKLEERLKRVHTVYSLSPACKTAADFPERVRASLEKFKPGDNLFDRGEELVVIWKIIGIYPSQAECLAALDRLGVQPEVKVSAPTNFLDLLLGHP